MKKSIRNNYPLFVFGVGITAFILIFTRYFLKTDDGNFLGIANASDFVYREFLTYRYNNISGRTVNELSVMFFCRHNIILWKLFISGLFIFIAYFFSRLSSYSEGETSKAQRQTFCSLSFFMMIISCLNSAAFWFSGSFTYLFVFAGLCAMSLPFIKYIYERQFCVPAFLAGAIGCVAACSQEQGVICCICLILLFLFFIKVRGLDFKPLFLIFIVISTGLGVHLFSSPGMKNRMESESSAFLLFNEMNVWQKLFCGVSTFFANSFYLSVALIIILTALLSAVIYDALSNKKLFKKILIAINIFVVFVTVVVNCFCCLSGKGAAHVLIRRDFINGSLSPESITLIVFGFLILSVIVFLSVVLIVKKRETGIPVLLCLGAGFGCAIMMSFSSSIFASGQRVFFFTNMFVIAGCIILFSSAKKTKLIQRVFSFSVFYAVLSIVINIFAFTFAEHALMG